jgi:8-oxo-dGTP pyrophosphatase MutT (NUDIX family)
VTDHEGQLAAPPVLSATVILVRDASGGGLEVLLLERHVKAEFAGGALVFPGGKVSSLDRDLDAARWTGRSITRWREDLHTASDPDALGVLAAAVRETFEESGVLLANREDGTPLRADDLTTPSFAAARQRLAKRGDEWDWRPWLADEGLVLDFSSLAFWSWWVTPEGQPRRFDTRFLVARLPSGQVAHHDDVETTGLRWTTPKAALEEQEQGRATIIFPTRRNLLALAPFETASEVWTAANAGRTDRRRIQPTIVMVDGRPMVQHPDEEAPSPV